MKSQHGAGLYFLGNFFIYFSAIASIFIWYAYMIQDPWNASHVFISVFVWLGSLMFGLTLSTVLLAFGEHLEQQYK